MIGELLAPIPGQGLIEFAGQFPGLFDQGGDDVSVSLLAILTSIT